MEHEPLIEHYIEYKKELLNYYEHFLQTSHPHSVVRFIETLRDSEKKHHNELMQNKEIKSISKINYCQMLALTPLHEIKTLSKAFKDIIAFKERTLALHCQHTKERFNSPEAQEMLHTIELIEQENNNNLVTEKMICNF